MSHNAQEIARLRALLARLEAEDAAEAVENDRANQTRPAGIPATWKPILFRQGDGTPTFSVVGWHDPGFTVGLLRRVVPEVRP